MVIVLERARLGLSKSTYLTLGLISIIVVGGGWATFVSTSNNQAQQTTTSSSRFVTTSLFSTSFSSGGNINEVWASSLSSNGIMMNASISPIAIATGAKVYLNWNAFNIRSEPNNVSATTNWAFSSLAGKCPGGLLGETLYSGYYTSANISSAKELPLLPPGGALCPSRNFAYYIFSPQSDNMIAFPSTIHAVYPTQVSVSCSLSGNKTLSGTSTTVTYATSSCTSSSYVESPSAPNLVSANGTSFVASTEIPFDEYWNQNSTSYTYFPSGQYSLLVGDIWGSYVILHFEVS